MNASPADQVIRPTGTGEAKHGATNIHTASQSGAKGGRTKR